MIGIWWVGEKPVGPSGVDVSSAGESVMCPYVGVPSLTTMSSDRPRAAWGSENSGWLSCLFFCAGKQASLVCLGCSCEVCDVLHLACWEFCIVGSGHVHPPPQLLPDLLYPPNFVFFFFFIFFNHPIKANLFFLNVFLNVWPCPRKWSFYQGPHS